jgi:hypothetical protein
MKYNKNTEYNSYQADFENFYASTGYHLYCHENIEHEMFLDEIYDFRNLCSKSGLIDPYVGVSIWFNTLVYSWDKDDSPRKKYDSKELLSDYKFEIEKRQNFDIEQKRFLTGSIISFLQKYVYDSEFLTVLKTEFEKMTAVATSAVKRVEGKNEPTLSEVALFCFYSKVRIDDSNKSQIASDNGYINKTSGTKLYNFYYQYQENTKRHGLTESKRIDTAHRKRLKRVLEILKDSPESLARAKDEFQVFENQYIENYLKKRNQL